MQASYSYGEGVDLSWHSHGDRPPRRAKITAPQTNVSELLLTMTARSLSAGLETGLYAIKATAGSKFAAPSLSPESGPLLKPGHTKRETPSHNDISVSFGNKLPAESAHLDP